MLLHLGSEVSIKTKDIILILDCQTVTDWETAEFLGNSQKSYKEINIDGECKSIVLTGQKGDCCIYRTPISAATLIKRCKKLQFKLFNA